MPRLSPRVRILFAILLLGVCSQIVQALLIRESLVVFYGNEVSLGAFFGSWLFWIALGSWMVVRWRDRPLVRQPRRSLVRIMLLLPFLLVAQLIAIRAVRALFDIPSIELVPLGDLFLSLSLITLPSSLALGLAFPLACKALVDLAGAPETTNNTVRDVSWLYVVEAMGALLGGVLFTFVLIQWVGVWRSLGGLTLALALGAWLLTDDRRSLRWVAGVLAVAGLALVSTPIADRLHAVLEQMRFATLQPGLELLDAVETRYGHVALARLGPQISVVRNGHIAESFPQVNEVRQTAAYVFSQAAGAERVLMFGGFAGGLTAELLRYPLQSLDLVQQDPRAFERIRPFLMPETQQALEDSRLHIHFLDGRRYLNRLSHAGLDLVLALDAVPTSAHSNRYFTREFYAQVRANLAPKGVFCTQLSSASNYLGATVRSYSGSIYQTLSSVFPHVAIMPGDTHLYCASAAADRVTEDPSALRDRYLATVLDEHRFPALSFYSLLPRERIQYVRDQLQAEDSDLNTDSRPVTYYLNMMLWGRFTASGFVEWLEDLRLMGLWPYLIPVGIFLLLWLLRSSMEGVQRPRIKRQAATYVLAVLGLAAMAIQLTIMFSYQARVGFMFERVALLNGLFMSGLALGAGIVGQRLSRAGRADLYLVGLLGLVTLTLLGLPMLLETLGRYPPTAQEGFYLVFSGLFGLLTGAGFPIGVHQAHRDLGDAAATGGISEAADSLGGAVGGLVTGALLVPLLGVEGTSRLLAILSLSAVLPVLYARYLPKRLPMLTLRGVRAFPWPLLGWGLLFLVLTLFGWDLVQRGTASGPQLQFQEQQLAKVSGSTRFRSDSGVLPFYSGWDDAVAETAPASTASLSSMVLAADVNGYAGPMNLLLSVDRTGRLRGVQYIDSNETPSYITGIQEWLDGLAGQDLGESGLDLERVDALSGATLSSQAALDAVNRSVRGVGREAYQREFAPERATDIAASTWTSPRLLCTLALLLVFMPVYLSGNEPARLLLQMATLTILGFWLNSLVTEMDLVNLSQGHWASLSENPQHWLLLAFVLVSAVLFGQVWCGYLCPFGALQEFVSRLGRLLGLRSYVNRPLETRMRFLKFVLLALMLSAVWLADDGYWASFNPMQHSFSGRMEGWMILLLVLTLVATLFHYRFWCRYLCPFGAFLALFNKIALLRRFAPKRRFEHCDLGVREEYDLDCIHCNRCLTGTDCRV